MRLGPADVDYPTAALVALSAATVVALVVAASTSSAAFGAFNTRWDGAADLRALADDADAESTLVRSTSRYADVPANGTVAVVLSPDRAYGPGEAAPVARFVERGGTLLVAEDYGPHANVLLSRVGADARLDGRPVRDERSHYRSPALPVATEVANATGNATDATADSIVRETDALTLNHGTVVRPAGASVLVGTSRYAYLDADRDGELDDAEALGRYPVATVERVGAGRVIVLSDASALVNAMLDRPGNRGFAAGLFAAHDRVLLDYSHAARLPPLALAVLVLRDAALAQVAIGLGAISLVALWWARPGLGGRLVRRERGGGAAATERLDEETLVEAVRRRHPEWDGARVRRVVKEISAAREKGRDDG